MSTMSPILVTIGYDVGIGFAIGRLISSFYEMGIRLTGDPSAVHFAFTKVGGGSNPSLPAGFSNLVEFDGNHADEAGIERLADYVKANDIKVIFGLDVPVEASYLGVQRRAGVRIIVSYIGAPCSSLNSGLTLALKRFEVRMLRPDKPDHFILESEAMRRTAVNGRGIAAACTSVVPTGVDVEDFVPMPEAKQVVFDAFQIPTDRKIVVYMGHMHERKGVHVLLRAADVVVTARKRRDIHFLILGNRPDEIESFRDCFDRAETSPFITIGGYRDHIPELLAGCYVGCIPSTGWDSFPMSSLEMQACGLPVIASDCQGVPETIALLRTGLVVKAGDVEALAEAVIQMADNPTERDRMAAAARERIVSSLSRNHQIERLTATMRDIVGQP
jgi:glycosyltransferase involved in cell wall biosynthesis